MRALSECGHRIGASMPCSVYSDPKTGVQHGTECSRTGQTRAQNAVRHSRVIRTVEREEGARFGRTDANIPVYLAHIRLTNGSETTLKLQFSSE